MMARSYEYSRLQRIEAAREYVDRVNRTTPCAHCGGGPIEWHNPTHVQGRKAQRIGYLVAHGRNLPQIIAEMEASTPLCRRCHMAEDGRLRLFAERSVARDRTKPAKPCNECERVFKPLRRGLCPRCYEHDRRRRSAA